MTTRLTMLCADSEIIRLRARGMLTNNDEHGAQLALAIMMVA